MVGAGIGNNGQVMSPYLVSQVLSPELDRARDGGAGGVLAGHVARERGGAARHDGHRRRPGHGVERARSPASASAGKTGTAQTAPGRPAHAWFVGVAPADVSGQAQVAVAVVLQNGGGAAEVSGNRLAAPIAQGGHGSGAGAMMLRQLGAGQRPGDGGGTVSDDIRRLGERYELGEVIGRGGMAEVYEGKRPAPRPPRRGEDPAPRPGARPVVPGPVPSRGAERGVAEPPERRRGLRHRRGRARRCRGRHRRDRPVHRHGVRRRHDAAPAARSAVAACCPSARSRSPPACSPRSTTATATASSTATSSPRT